MRNMCALSFLTFQLKYYSFKYFIVHTQFYSLMHNDIQNSLINIESIFLLETLKHIIFYIFIMLCVTFSNRKLSRII